MCLVLLAFKQLQHYPLIVLSNRDEFYSRTSDPLKQWNDHPEIYAGRDHLHGGAWFGVNKSGRFAIITNYRGQKRSDNKLALSRGDIVKEFLLSSQTPRDFLTSLQLKKSSYLAFNVILGDSNEVFSYSSVNDEIKQLTSGIYGLSNSLLDVPWPKLVYGKELFSKALKEYKEDNVSNFFAILANKQQFPDEKLPQTFLSIEQERMASAIFLENEAFNYGTCASSVLTIDDKNQVNFYEKKYISPGAEAIKTELSFSISHS